jgi:pimeloyl-ACP methyl ester carboxylesterase
METANLLHILIWVLALLIVAVLLGIIYQSLGIRRDLKLNPPPGKLINIGTHRLHLLDIGRPAATSVPTILLEAGLMSTILSWNEVRDELIKSFRVVSYDRAGLGWSDAGPNPRTLDRLVDELHLLLERAAIPPPFILAGHSFGGLTMPLFAARYPNETLGLVLVDPVAPAEWNPPSEQDRKRVDIGSRVCRRASLLARIGVIRFIAFLLTSRAKKLADYLVSLISRGTPAGSGTVSSPLFWNLPANERAMTRVFWVQEKFCTTIASQLENLPRSAVRVAELGNFTDKPVVILSANSIPPHRLKEHISMAQRLPQGRHVIADKSSHWIMQDQPELVIAAITEIAQFAVAPESPPPVTSSPATSEFIK